MKTNRLTISLLSILCVVLIAATALCAIGCGQQKDNKAESESISSTEVMTEAATDVNTTQTVGTGEKEFLFTVTDANGAETFFTVKTDRETVGEALEENGLIFGENGEYGLYVKVVNGITADYDTDGSYWAFYINGEYGMTGVDKTPIESGCNYGFKVEK